MPTGTLRSQMRNTSKNAIFGKYVRVRRHLVLNIDLVHGKGVFYKCETPLGCKLQYKHLCSQRKISVPNCFTHSLYYFMFYPY